MAFGTTFKNDLAKLIFQATAIANLADNAASSPATSLHLGLYTADPSAGDQTTNEISYTPYARQAVVRTSSGWSVSGAVVSPLATVSFPTMTSGTGGTATHGGVGVALTGTGKLIIAGAISPTIAVSASVTPQFTTGSTITIT